MQPRLDLPALPTILTVSQLNRRVRDVLEATCNDCWVAGEISNFRVPASGHFYFILKDARSQIAAVMFRSANQVLPFRPADGLEVIIRGRVGLYDVRGSLQLYAETMEPRGVGSLQLALEQLKKRLAAEGLFAEERKRPLPFMPHGVGIVTALTGAAIHDMLVVLNSRLPSVRVVIRPVRVQGKDAAPEIVRALADLNRVQGIDVVIVGRGGGSIEDLWVFNDEQVARAIVASPVPVVSAVGHEIDVTIADLVADRRAPTPTAAAAMVVPDHTDLIGRLRALATAACASMQRHLRRHHERVAVQARQLRHPRQALTHWQMRVDELSERAQRGVMGSLRRARQELRGCAERLQALSPLAVLQRGYSIAQRIDDGSVVRSAETLSAGQHLRLTFAHGAVRVRVDDSGID